MRPPFLALALLLACAPAAHTRVERQTFTAVADNRLWLRGEVAPQTLIGPSLAIQFAEGPVTLWIDSPGGDVGAGLEFIGVIREAQQRGVALTCIVDGMAASMAAVILEACDLRLMRRQSSLLFHTVSVSMAPAGNQWTYERLVEEMREWNKRLAIFVVGRLKISMTEYEAHVHNKDWWLGYEEALDVGAVDGAL